MLKAAIAVLFLLAVATPAASVDAELNEIRDHFTLGGKPVPPEIFVDFGNGDPLESAKSVRVALDLRAAVGSTLYADPVTVSGDGWISQRKKASQEGEAISYKFSGATRNGLIVVLSSFYGGGTGRYATLHILDVAEAHAFESDGKLYGRLNLTQLRAVPLGDRWRGRITIAGDTISVVTEAGEPNNGNTEPTTQRIEAIRPD